MHYMLVLVLYVITCVGCAPIHRSDAKIDHVLHSQFDIDDSIQSVITRVVNKKSECRTPIFPENIITLEDMGEAHIEYRHSNFNLSIMFLIDLKRQDNKTRVDIYYTSRFPGGERAFRTLEYGAKNLPGCP